MAYYKHLYEQTKLMLEKYQDEIVPELCEQLEQVEQERDAAISNLYSVCEDSGDACGLCKHLPRGPGNGKCLGWQWRGPQKEE